LGLGVGVVKYFPAEAAGGAEFIRSVAAPMPEARFIPTGGVTLENLETYLRIPQVVACGSSSVCARSLVDAGNFAEITSRARKARATISRVRPETAGSAQKAFPGVLDFERRQCD